MRKSIAAVVAVAAASLAIAGIAPAASAADGKDVAKAIVSKYSKNPTSIGNLPPITKPIPKGKYVITMAADSPSGVELNKKTVEAGKTLGWKMETMTPDASVEGARKILQQAIAKKPDGIAVSGLDPVSAYGDLFKKAEKEGIVIICTACMSRPYAALKDTHVAGPKMLDLWGQMIAAYTVANVTGTPNVQMFGLSVYPILLRFDEAYQKNLKKLSPKAKYTFQEVDMSSFPQSVATQVANTYKANPSTNFVTSDLGDWFIGTPQALFTAGATPGQKPQIGGLTAGTTNIQGLKDKTQNAWTGYSLAIVGYSAIDSFARYWTDTKFATADLPTQILTQKNVGSAVIGSNGFYVGVKDYASQFKKVWGVK